MCIRDSFRTCVVNDFIGQYQKGVTPNPCIVCNRMVKEKSLLDKAKEIGGKYIATVSYTHLKIRRFTGAAGLGKLQGAGEGVYHGRECIR